MNRNYLSALALIVAVVALGFAALQPLYGERPDAGEAALPSLDVMVLQERVSALERRLTEQRLVPPSTEPVRLPVSARGRASADVEGRLTALEEDLFRLEARARTLDDLAERDYRVVRLGLDEETLGKWTDQALDEDANEAQRLEALRHLRGQVREEGVDARLAVLHAMLALAESSADVETRTAIWRQLEGLDDPILIDPLLASMRGDSSPHARAAAARALAPFRADPAIVTALEDVLAHDPDELVKDAAFEARYGQLRRPVREVAER